jgi:hypothetical protein
LPHSNLANVPEIQFHLTVLVFAKPYGSQDDGCQRETVHIFFFVLGRLFAANEKRGNGGVVVDTRGTVIYPEEIGPGPDFAGITNRETANAAAPAGLREQYLEVVNKIHPDRAANEADLALRERLMKEANAAFERGDAETLRRVLEEYRVGTLAS